MSSMYRYLNRASQQYLIRRVEHGTCEWDGRYRPAYHKLGKAAFFRAPERKRWLEERCRNVSLPQDARGKGSGEIELERG